MTNFLFLTGETAANGAQTQEGSLLGMLLPVILIFVVFYFMLIRPEKKRKKEVDSMRNSIKVGDKVTTIGGIIGVVTYVNNDEDVIAIKSGIDGAELRFARWAIGTKAPAEEPANEIEDAKEE